MISTLLIFSDWSILILRLVFGVIFLAHGWPKIKDLKVNSQNFAMMGFKPGAFWGTIAAFVEFFGALALIVGLYTQVAALLIAIQMLVAALWKMKNKQGLIGGYEFDLTLAAAALLLATLGGGLNSLDSYLRISLL